MGEMVSGMIVVPGVIIVGGAEITVPLVQVEQPEASGAAIDAVGANASAESQGEPQAGA